LSQGESLRDCAECGVSIPAARRDAIHGVRLCVTCQAQRDKQEVNLSGYNRRGSKDSQLR
jgi:RNA polymerase-binding transcription factor DksA